MVEPCHTVPADRTCGNPFTCFAPIQFSSTLNVPLQFMENPVLIAEVKRNSEWTESSLRRDGVSGAGDGIRTHEGLRHRISPVSRILSRALLSASGPAPLT